MFQTTSSLLARFKQHLKVSPKNIFSKWHDKLHKQVRTPCNHVWNSWCYRLHLCCELVPICNISICIWYISYVENYIIIWQVLDELVSSVKCTRIFTTVFIWAITFSLKWNRKKYESFSHQSCYNKLNLANNTHSYKNF